MKRIIFLLASCFLLLNGYAQRMNVTIRVVAMYSNVNDWADHRISLSMNGSPHIQDLNNSKALTPNARGWTALDVNTTDSYVYRSITVNGFNGIDIDFFGWLDRCNTSCDGMHGTRYNETCYCKKLGLCIKCGDNDTEKDDKNTKINFWEFEPGKKGQTIEIFTRYEKYGLRFQVDWTPANPVSIQANRPSYEYCGGEKIVLRTTNYPTVVQRDYKNLSYNWYEVNGSTYTFIGSTSADSIVITSPSNAVLGSSIPKRYAVYTTAYNVSSLDPTALANTIQVYTPSPTNVGYLINPASCNGMSDGNLVINSVTGQAGSYSYILTGSSVLNSAKNTFPVTLPNDAPNKPTGMAGLPAGAYVLTVSNYYAGVSACSLKVPVVITQPLPLSVYTVQKSAYNGFNVSCNGSANGSAIVSGIGGNTPYTFLWDDEITFTNPVTSSNGSFNNLKSGTYYTKITDAKKCPVNPVSVTFTEPTILTTLVQKTDVLCNGAANGQINMTTMGGAGGYTFSLNNNPFISTLPFAGLAPGDYGVIAKDKNNCTVASINTLITEPPALVLSVSDKQDILCNGASTGSVNLNGTGGVGTYLYSYDGTNYQSSGAFNSIPAGTYNLKVKDKNSCIASVSSEFTQPPALQNTFAIQNVTCLGREDGSVKANLSGGVKPYSYNWLGRTEKVDSIRNLYAGNYTVAVRDANNCSLQQTATVNAPATSLIIESVSNSHAKCEGICDGTITVNVSGGVAPYTYYYNTIQSGNNVLTSACGAHYTVKVKDSYNCIVTDNTLVPLTSSFGFDLPDSVTLCTGQSYMVDITAPNTSVALTSLKGFSSTSKNVQLSVTDHYYLYLSNAQGCFKKDTMVLTTSSDLLKSRFIVPSRSYAGDTINFVDLSWPRPDSVSWALSVPADTIGNNEGFIRLSYQDAGSYTIKLTAYMGACRDSVTKTITFDVPPPRRIYDDSLSLGFRSINTLKLYPIPNSGRFIVEISASHTDEITTSILNMFGEVIHIQALSGSLVYKTNYDFLRMSPGMYVFWVKSQNNARVLKFLVE